LLRALDDLQIAVVLAAVVFEERKSDLFQRVPATLLGPFKADAERVVERIAERERDLGIHPPTRRLDFKIGSVVQAWWDGWSFDEIGTLTNASHGDLVRTLRLILQLVRQMKKVFAADAGLSEQFGRIFDRINREEIDAQRQLEMGDEPTAKG
jgi:superfamily II RNA helicase